MYARFERHRPLPAVRAIIPIRSSPLSQYSIPAQETRVEIAVVNSRFIATAAPVFTVDEAKAFVSRIKQEFSDASHNVSLYRRR
jgi:putative IMPACT (imprinted ancient) family translation regulator